MKSLQHHQHGIKEVVACKRFKRLHGQHQGGMNDSVWRILKTLEPVQLEVYERQCPRVILTSWGRLWGVSPGKPQQKQQITHRLCSSSQSRSWTSWQTARTQMRGGQKTTDRSCKNKHQHVCSVYLNNSHLHMVHAHAHVPTMLRSYSACYSCILCGMFQESLVHLNQYHLMLFKHFRYQAESVSAKIPPWSQNMWRNLLDLLLGDTRNRTRLT